MKILALFPTYILMDDLEGPNISEMNKSLYNAISERVIQGVDPGITKSNAGTTWHSGYDLSDWCTGIDLLTGLIQKAAAKYAVYYGAEDGGRLNFQTVPWAMYSRGTGDYAVPHTHPRCQISGVYYVHVGEPAEGYPYSGRIELFNPTPYGHCGVPGMRGWHRREIIPPKPGRLLMFPAELLHMVHPFYGTGERVAVAFNIHIRSYTPPEKEGT